MSAAVTTQTVAIQVRPGETYNAFLAVPAAARSPALVLMQYICGVNKVMRDLATEFAAAGYLTIVPDLFWRQEPGVTLMDDPSRPTPAEWKRALELNQGFDDQSAVDDLKAALAFVRAHPRGNGAAGSLGYCLGGRMAWLMATHTDSDCNVGYYGVNIDKTLDRASSVTSPLLLHVAGQDDLVPGEAVQRIVDVLRARPGAEVVVHGGVNHAFALPGGPNWCAAAAKAANLRSLAFLETHLMRVTSN